MTSHFALSRQLVGFLFESVFKNVKLQSLHNDQQSTHGSIKSCDFVAGAVTKYCPHAPIYRRSRPERPEQHLVIPGIKCDPPTAN